CSVLLFPGQGSQAVGMGRGLLGYPRVRELYAAASRVLGYDLLELSLHGPQEDLDRTVHCQPAVFVASLAAVEKLHHLKPQVIENCVAAAGFSVGEFAALVFAGAMEFSEDASCGAQQQRMASSSTLPCAASGLLSGCRELAVHPCHSSLDGARLKPPSFPQALQFLRKNSSKYHFRRTKMLPVSGAFHTRLMEPAVEPLARVLKTIDVKKPLVAVYSNVSGNRYTHPTHIRKLLGEQVVSPVKWEQTMHAVYQREKGAAFPSTFEVGPGTQLGSILRSCNMQAWKSYSHVDVMEGSQDPEPGTPEALH
ncbi:PREDICTED: malonyl-CoA-acyl carrier protein transacylase, mitochondrial, partial [Dipodomys ordii]|uniref:Malonyl-CoA-acyl carrier protein transacylase, mitochondrial n=1 Tax=Dipodomys ordii TaxID=10020 RepID=A0A1S3FUI2_DIPOR